MSRKDIDRLEFLLQRRFPGFTLEVQAAIRAGLHGPKKFHDETMGELPSLSESWDLRGASIEKPRRTGDSEADTLAYRQFLKTWINEAQAYEKYLLAMPDDDYFVLYAKERQAEQIKKDQSDDQRDLDRFFSEPGASVDMAYWRSMPSWTVEEATVISLGKDPTTVTAKALKSVERDDSPFVREFERRLRLIGRTADTNELPSPILPGNFLTWAEAKGLKIYPSTRPIWSEATTAEMESLRRQNSLLAAQLEETKNLLAQYKDKFASWDQPFGEMTSGTRRTISRIVVGLAKEISGCHGKEKIKINKIVTALFGTEYQTSHGAIDDCIIAAESLLENPDHFKQQKPSIRKSKQSISISK